MAAIAVGTASAFAQLASDMNLKTFHVVGDYNLFGVSYDNTHLSNKYGVFEDDKGAGYNGFGLEYTHGFGLSHSLPMHIELGAKFNLGFYSLSDKDSYGHYDYKYTFSSRLMRLSIPVSYAYSIAIGDNMAITPYIGLDFRFNLLANGTSKEEEYLYDDFMDEDKYSWSFFDKEEMDDETWQRFQMGWHIGVRFAIEKVFLGINYGTDFMPIYKDPDSSKYNVNSQNLAVTLGIRF